ncbi:hypothetical protein Plhal304r1_c008g0031801 [Plasmopara halstedii]
MGDDASSLFRKMSEASHDRFVTSPDWYGKAYCHQEKLLASLSNLLEVSISTPQKRFDNIDAIISIQMTPQMSGAVVRRNASH